MTRVKGKKNCAVTYIDFAAAFDSVSHHFLDKALRGKTGASRKTRVMFRAIYSAAGAARIRGTDGMFTSFSKTFDIARGVIH